LDGLSTVGSLAADLVAGACFENRPHHLPNLFTVVYDQDALAHFSSVIGRAKRRS
jgi:hypothetical protein